MGGLRLRLCAGAATGLWLPLAGALAAQPVASGRSTLAVGAVVEPSCRVASGAVAARISCSPSVSWIVSPPQRSGARRSSAAVRYVTITY